MKKSISGIFICFALLSFSSPLFSEETVGKNTWTLKMRQKNESIPQKSFEEEKGEVIGGKSGEEIKKFMLVEAKKLKNINGAIVSTIRNGEVLKVSIPSSVIFPPNETTLLPNPELALGPILTFMRQGLTTMLVTGHSDNTGSETYLQRISQGRAQGVFEWYKTQGIPESNMKIYAFGASQPLFTNDSMENRAKNRRVTIYLIPNDEMVKKAKRKKLNKN
ncbi:MAG: OmpA family protein [Bacteroidales bacterium]